MGIGSIGRFLSGKFEARMKLSVFAHGIDVSGEAVDELFFERVADGDDVFKVVGGDGGDAKSDVGVVEFPQ